MQTQPLRNGLFVLQDPIRDDVTPSGIVIAASAGIVDSQSQLGRTGTIQAMGPDADDSLSIGMRILYGEFSHPEYVEDGVKYIRLTDEDIVGVVEE